MFNRVFVLGAAQEAGLAFPSCSGGCNPSAQNRVPAGKADPRGEVGHDEPEVILAPFGVDPWEAGQVPFFKPRTESFR